MKKDSCVLYLIRHGETEWNRDDVVMGHSDSPLTDTGVQQASDLAHTLSSVNFSSAFSSDSPRATRTAEIALGDRAVSIGKSEKLRERNFSRFEGLSVEEFVSANKESFLERDALSGADRWGHELSGCVESDESVITRFLSELHKIALANIGGTVLVATHGGPIRLLLVKLGFASYEDLPPGSFKNAGHVVVVSDGTGIRIEKVEGMR